MLAMVTDHAAYLFVSAKADRPLYLALRMVGRITFTVLAFMLTQGFEKTKNIPRYLLRMAAFAVISTGPYYLVFGKWKNVFFTLLTGLCMLVVISRVELNKEKKCCNIYSRALRMFIAGVFAYANGAAGFDWGMWGIAFIYLFWEFKDVPLGRLWAVSLTSVGYLAYGVLRARSFSFLTGNSAIIFVGVFLAVPLLLLYDGRRGKPLKYVFYGFYPAHLLVLWVLKLILK
jgi:hypothetical protein